MVWRRQKGTANKATARLREAFAELIEDEMCKVQKLFRKVAEKNPQGIFDFSLKSPCLFTFSKNSKNSKNSKVFFQFRYYGRQRF